VDIKPSNGENLEEVAVVHTVRTTATELRTEVNFKFSMNFPDVLKPLVLEAVTENEKNREKLADVLLRYKEAFSLHGEYGCVVNFEHEIPTGDATPIKQGPYRLPLWGTETVEKCINEMLEAQVIVKCRQGEETEWASSVALVKKKDGSIRFCIDNRKLNSVVKKSVHPIPNVGAMFDVLGRTSLFRISLLDMKSAYWSVKVAEKDMPKTAFVVENFGTYKCLRMPFGLSNAPSSFQSLVEKLLPVARGGEIGDTNVCWPS